MIGELVSTDDLNAILVSIAPNASVDDEYDNFLQPTQKAIEALASKWDPKVFSCGSIRKDWPLCYDFAECCAAAIRVAAYREDWPCRPAFGVLRYTTTRPAPPVSILPDTAPLYRRHAINFVVLDDCHVRYFEPQTGEWMEQPVDLKSLDNLYI